VVLRSDKRSSASGSCRAILRSKGRPLCAQKLPSSVRVPQRRTRALHARFQSSGACAPRLLTSVFLGMSCHSQRVRQPMLQLPITMDTGRAGWARQRRLELPAKYR
jgi:hypothetical protein